MGNVMYESGYSKSSSRIPKLLTDSNGWQELLAQVDDTLLMDKLYQIAMDKSDKRACMEAIKEIYKLKDKYPSSKYKVESAGEELQGLFIGIAPKDED